MRQNRIHAMAAAGLLTAVAVVGSLFTFPVLGSMCAPVQHMVNVVCAVFMGPWYGVAVAFAASLIRNILGLGTPMAFPGSMVGALLCGLVYARLPRLSAACVAEVVGTGVLGGLCAYPVAILLVGKDPGQVAFYAYIVPFLISTVCGSVIAGAVLAALRRTGALAAVQRRRAEGR